MTFAKWYKVNGNEMIDRIDKNFDKFLMITAVGKNVNDNITSIMPSDIMENEIYINAKNGKFEEIIFVPENAGSTICVSDDEIFIGSDSKENFKECIKKLAILDLKFNDEFNKDK